VTKRLLALALVLASAATLSACGSSSGDGDATASVSSIGKCAHARPQTISPSTPVARMIAQKVVSGGWLFQSAGEETEAEEREHAPGFDVYVFPDNKTATEAFALISGSENAADEFGGGGTFIARNIIITTDQESPQLDVFADALLKKCAHSSATQSIHREEDSTEGASSEVPPSPEASPTGEVGAPGQSEPSARQSPVPGQGE
jgi:predicted small secreted protein